MNNLGKIFNLPTLELAKEILGYELIHETKDGIIGGKIVEVEAYIGPDDKASHAFGGKITKRNNIMYGAPAKAYIYLIYGMYYMFNIVSGKVNQPEAILVRALDPTIGIELMAKYRNFQMPLSKKKLILLTNGPGKVCQALGITQNQNGWDLLNSPLHINHPNTPIANKEIMVGKRIGIDYAEEAKEYPWRFWLKGNQFVSRK